MRQYHISRERFKALQEEHEEIVRQQQLHAEITGTVLAEEDYGTCTVIYGTCIDNIRVIDLHDLMYYENVLGYDYLGITNGDDAWNPEDVVIDVIEYIDEWEDDEDEEY